MTQRLLPGQLLRRKGLGDRRIDRLGWAPLLVALLLGFAAALAVTSSRPIAVIPLLGLIPAAILFSRHPFAAVLLWIALFPFFVREPSVAGRVVYWLLHRTMIPGALVVVILSSWLGERWRGQVRFGRAELAMLLFLLLTATSILLLGQNPLRSYIRFYDRIFVPFCMYWLIRLIGPGERELRQLTWAGLITLLTQAAIGITSWFVPGLLPAQWLGEEGERTVGTFGNPAVYTSTLIFLGLLLLHYAMQQRSGRLRLALASTFGLVAFCVFLSFSRGSWLGGLVVLAGLLFVYPRAVGGVMTALLVAALALASLGVLSNQLDFASQRLSNQQTGEDRIIGDIASIRMIRARPLLGWGYDNYDLYNSQFKTSVGSIANHSTTTSHNTYLTLMAEQGVGALLLYVAPALWWLRLSLKVRLRLPRQGLYSRGLLALLWLLMLNHFIVSNFMDMIRFNMFGTTVWWMALALIANLVYAHLRPDDMGPAAWVRQGEPAGLVGL